LEGGVLEVVDGGVVVVDVEGEVATLDVGDVPQANSDRHNIRRERTKVYERIFLIGALPIATL
jgi:uncharacterized protein with ACT and thioredoxin-like domain